MLNDITMLQQSVGCVGGMMVKVGCHYSECNNNVLYVMKKVRIFPPKETTKKKKNKKIKRGWFSSVFVFAKSKTELLNRESPYFSKVEKKFHFGFPQKIDFLCFSKSLVCRIILLFFLTLFLIKM